MIVKSRYLRRYGKEMLVEGQQFESTDKDSRFFKRAGWADDAPPPPPPRVVQRAPARAAQETVAVEATPATHAPDTGAVTRYSRRDMRPEE
jgi:hypothetical protein